MVVQDVEVELEAYAYSDEEGKIGVRDCMVRQSVSLQWEYLSGEVQPRHLLGLQSVSQHARVHVVVLHVIPRPNDVSVLHAPNTANDFGLYLQGEGPGQPIGVDEVGGQALGFQPYRVSVSLREPLHLLPLQLRLQIHIVRLCKE